MDLPEYMIPSHIVVVPSLPLTSNGKVDRRALPKPVHRSQRPYVAPENELERKVAGIWADLLEKERISVEDSFFELGGHSLKAMLLVS